jgi:hypothetical protein
MTTDPQETHRRVLTKLKSMRKYLADIARIEGLFVVRS